MFRTELFALVKKIWSHGELVFSVHQRFTGSLEQPIWYTVVLSFGNENKCLHHHLYSDSCKLQYTLNTLSTIAWLTFLNSARLHFTVSCRLMSRFRGGGGRGATQLHSTTDIMIIVSYQRRGLAIWNWIQMDFLLIITNLKGNIWPCSWAEVKPICTKWLQISTFSNKCKN